VTLAATSTSSWEQERRWLGYAGLIPFVGCVAILYLGEPAWRASAIDMLRNYAALIASFLGAVHWGVATDNRDGRQHARLRWGVVPALIAWTLLTLPDAFAFVGLAVLFALILTVDRYLLPVLDDRYRRLRMQLSVVVIITLVAAAGATA
jgi:hypothetical protein